MFHYDLNDLLLFVNVADAENLTKGADTLGLTAPSASSRLKKFEDALGVELFERLKRGLRITAAGKVVLQQARKALMNIEELDLFLQPFRRRQSGVIRVFANSVAAIDFLPRDIAVFLLENPNVRIELEQRSSPEVVKAVLLGEADIGIGADKIDSPLLRFHHYHTHELVAVLPKNHVLNQYSALPYKTLLGFDFVGLPTKSYLQRFLEDKAMKCGKTLCPKVRVDNLQILLDLVEAGVGIAVVPKTNFDKSQLNQRFHLISIKEPWAKRHLNIMLSAVNESQNSLIGTFKACLLTPQRSKLQNG